MKPAIDAETLIACSACAKAKAKCDKRIPTCSRCVFKRQKCEPRQPRRYPEAFQFLQSESPSQSHTMSLLASTAPSPQTLTDATVDQNTFAPESAYEGTMSGEAADSIMHQFDSSFPSGSAFFPAVEDSSMEYDFTANNFGIGTLQSQSLPSDSIHATGLCLAIHELATTPSNFEKSLNGAGVIAATNEDWPCFGCNPSTHRSINPRTGSEYLMRLEKSLDEQPAWKTSDVPVPISSPEVHVEPVEERLRDKLMVISQGFFIRARDVHHTGTREAALAKRKSSSNANFTGFFILPPAFVLEAFLRTYASRVETYMPFFPGAIISPTGLIASNDEKASVLLLLLMIAQGAMGSALCEAQHFASGLIETCRICIFDVMEKNVQLAAHPVMLRCALLYLQASAWSGNKWHMDLSAAQLHIFTSMLRYARMLDARKSSLAGVDVSNEAEAGWKTWQTEERLNRLVYSWVALDQEMNLFHDRQPDLDITELNAPMPESDTLWNATSAEMWLSRFIDTQKSDAQNLDPNGSRRSLASLFKHFMSDELPDNALELSLMELRLLLHPLQALIYHLNKSLLYFSNSGSQRVLQRLLTQLEEVQYLLKKWYSIAQRTLRQSDTSTTHGCCNMVLYHLTSLNTLTYFPDIERLARREMSVKEFRESLWMGKRCSEDAAQIWCHCGQILRYFQQLPVSIRPYWWSASIYRVALCLWATSLSCKPEMHGASLATGREYVAVDARPFDHPSIVRFLRHQDGTPIVSHADGSPTVLDHPVDIIKHCINVLQEEGSESPLVEGIKTRLSILVDRLLPPGVDM